MDGGCPPSEETHAEPPAASLSPIHQAGGGSGANKRAQNLAKIASDEEAKANKGQSSGKTLDELLADEPREDCDRNDFWGGQPPHFLRSPRNSVADKILCLSRVESEAQGLVHIGGEKSRPYPRREEEAAGGPSSKCTPPLPIPFPLNTPMCCPSTSRVQASSRCTHWRVRFGMAAASPPPSHIRHGRGPLPFSLAKRRNSRRFLSLYPGS